MSKYRHFSTYGYPRHCRLSGRMVDKYLLETVAIGTQ